MLRVEQLTKVFGRRVRANDGISFDLDAGEVVGILGPNGAGKTTLLRQMVGLMRPTSGHVELQGRPVIPGAGWLRRQVAYLPQHPLALLDLTVFEAVWTTAVLRGQPPAEARARSLRLLDTLGLLPFRDRLVAHLSGGEHRLVTIAVAVVSPTPLMCLDEPSNELDPLMRRRVWDLVGELRQPGRLVLLVSHNVLEAEAVLDRVLILHRGRVFASGTPAALRAEQGSGIWLEVRYRGEDGVLGDAGAEAAPAADGVRQVRLRLSRADAERRLTELLSNSPRAQLLDVHLREPSLEELYLSYRAAMSDVEGAVAQEMVPAVAGNGRRR